MLEPTRDEPGNIDYDLRMSTERPYEFVFDEIFSLMDAFKEHTQEGYIQNLGQRLKDLLAALLEIETYSEV
jgi:quinol monooxygenase YgiN